MFFRRKRQAAPTAAGQLDALRAAGFTAEPAAEGAVRVSRGACAIDMKEQTDLLRATGGAGVLIGQEIAALMDGGYQKFFRTPSGKRRPATSDDLAALHDFEEDIKEALGEQSYYNESLGTVSTYYLYDRVKDRDRGVPRRAWE